MSKIIDTRLCVDCQTEFGRINGRQVRCPTCQHKHALELQKVYDSSCHKANRIDKIEHKRIANLPWTVVSDPDAECGLITGGQFSDADIAEMEALRYLTPGAKLTHNKRGAHHVDDKGRVIPDNS